ncbi:MAG: CHAD domain-containing protein [Chitinophagales bacterium]
MLCLMDNEKKSSIIKYYKNQILLFDFYFERTLKSKSKEDLHQMRVSIKRLKAIWSMMEMATSGKWQKKQHYKLFDKLFDAAGKVRELEVNSELIEKYNSSYLDSYNKYLQNTQEGLNRELFVRMQSFDHKNFEALNNKLLQKMKGLSYKVVLKESARYIQKEVKKVLKLNDELPNNRKLHKIRIHLKAANEILTIINELNTRVSLKKLQTNIKSLNERVGKWHDYTVLLSSLKHLPMKRWVKKIFSF